jgi:hypothetical protein
MKKREDKGRLSPFVPLLIATLDTPAWRALSHGAARLYVALLRRYNRHQHNNGRIYLSQRMAHKELRSNFTEITRWFRELEHYGFIVKTTPGCLGSDGKGKAPHWRLTELGTRLEQPTRDFLSWKGVKFRAPKVLRKTGAVAAASKIQNPAPVFRSGVLRKTGAVALRKTGAPNPGSAPETQSIQEPNPAPENGSVTRLTTPCASDASAAAAPAWPNSPPDPTPLEPAIRELIRRMVLVGASNDEIHAATEWLGYRRAVSCVIGTTRDEMTNGVPFKPRGSP